ncbi:hypothetical protein HDU99_006337 [Rhizoclosmatium hyalinum]|nr:hypothetical protein HDU99_006337 [Rhizoclosmatium hyalinum]
MALYTCVFGGAPVVGLAVLVVLLVSCFVSIAAVAGGFLCANLSAMAALLQLGESVAGVTLAALGNGAPDIFATFSAVRANNGAMALGELLGAALFVTLVVVGAVAFVSDDTALPRRPFIRDLLFLIGCICIVVYISHTGEISFAISIVFILYYLIYVGIVVLGHFLHKGNNSGLSSGGHGHVIDVHNIDAIDADPHSEARDVLGHPMEDSDTDDNIPYNDFYDIDSSGAGYPFSNASETTAQLRGRRHFVPHLNKELFPFLAAYSQPDHDQELDAEGSDDETQLSHSTSIVHKFLAKLDKHRPLIRALRNSIVPYLARWDSMTLKERIFSLSTTPIGTALKLTIPIVHRGDVEKLRQYSDRRNSDMSGELGPLLDRDDDIDEDAESSGLLPRRPQPSRSQQQRPRVPGRLLMAESDRYLVSMQLFFGTQFAASVLMARGDHAYNSIVWVSSCILGSIFASVAFFTSKTNTMPTMLRFNLLCFFGFIVSIVWVYTVANEIVGLLETIGIILHIDEVILGLTIFAVGNCMGDLMTNLSIARMGFPKMALGACFGAPLMNFLLGLGISALSMTAESRGSFEFETGPVLRKATIYLLASLVTTLFLVGASGFKTNQQIGKILLGEYVAIVFFILVGA